MTTAAQHGKKIDTEIQAFTTNRDKLRDSAHSIAMMIFYHAAPKEISADCLGYGDCTRALKLVKAMPKSWASQMTEWFRINSPIRVVAANDKFGFDPKYLKLSREDKLSWWKLEEAIDAPFFVQTEPESQVKVLDFMAIVKLIEALSKRIEKKIADDEVKPEDQESAKLIAGTLAGLHFERIKPDITNDNVKTTDVVGEKTAAEDLPEQQAA